MRRGGTQNRIEERRRHAVERSRRNPDEQN
jgi:hypothetical protein